MSGNKQKNQENQQATHNKTKDERRNKRKKMTAAAGHISHQQTCKIQHRDCCCISLICPRRFRRSIHITEHFVVHREWPVTELISSLSMGHLRSKHTNIPGTGQCETQMITRIARTVPSMFMTVHITLYEVRRQEI